MKEKCIKQKTGSCAGCNIIEIGKNKVRWKGYCIEKVKAYLVKNYCPDGLTPDLERFFNQLASHGMGQHRHENLEGLKDIRP